MALTAKAQAGTFHDPAMPPTDRDLAGALGPADPLWRRFTHDVRVSCGPLTDEWSFSKAFGWTHLEAVLKIAGIKATTTR